MFYGLKPKLVNIYLYIFKKGIGQLIRKTSKKKVGEEKASEEEKSQQKVWNEK